MPNFSTPPSLVICGYTNIDINITPLKTAQSQGGAAFFTALAASKIDNEVGLVTRIGHDFNANFLLKHIRPEGIHVFDGKPTAKSTQIYSNINDLTQREIKLEWGVAPDVSPLDIPKNWLTKIKHIHVATMPPPQQAEFLSFIKREVAQATISIDSDIIFLKDEKIVPKVLNNFLQANIVFANRREQEKIDHIFAQIPMCVVKMDQNGASIYKYGELVVSSPAPKSRVVDVTGAGDIFAGTFLAEFNNTNDLDNALDLAISTASHSVEQEGVEHLF